MIASKKGLEESMKIKATGAILALLSLAVCLIPTTIHAAGLSLTPTQGIVGTQVSIPAICGYGTGNYQLYWGEADQLISQGEIEEGCVAIDFIVPEAARGKNKVTLKVGGDSFTSEFTIIPSISLSTEQGAVGSNLTVNGKGFNSSESNIQITYDGTPVQTDIVADNKGSWQSTFKVPSSGRGQHTIDAKGTTPATEVADLTFTVNPKITITPTSGCVGTVIGIVGSGFGVGETNIKVTYDGLAVKTEIGADSEGSWQSSFSIPTSAKGSHGIDAYGAVTPEGDVAEANFIVSPGIKLELVSGYLGGAIHAGDSLWVGGVGFETNETGIIVTFDGNMAASGIIADAKGSWSARLEVPPTTKGEHTIDASGETTKANDVAGATIIVSPKVEINPTSGAIGEDVVIIGTGFGQNKVITISYDGTQVAAGSATDAKGSFTASFKVPKSKAGSRTIIVTDAAASVVSTNFDVESTPPPTPQLISPEAGKEFSVISKATVTFDWSDVNDPSGVYYLLEISPNADFSGVVIRKEALTASEYTLTDKEALAKGDYYWRVRAIDDAENQSDWTNGQLFKVRGLQWWWVVLIIIGAAVLIVVIWRLVHMRRRGEWK
jgi:hypothetical protein